MWVLVHPSSSDTGATEAQCVEFDVAKVYCLRKGLLNAITLNVTYPHAVNIDGVPIGNRIYWTLTLGYSEWLHFWVHYYTRTSTSINSNVFTAVAW
jgi:hypothetical protein